MAMAWDNTDKKHRHIKEIWIYNGMLMRGINDKYARIKKKTFIRGFFFTSKTVIIRVLRFNPGSKGNFDFRKIQKEVREK